MLWFSNALIYPILVRKTYQPHLADEYLQGVGEISTVHEPRCILLRVYLIKEERVKIHFHSMMLVTNKRVVSYILSTNLHKIG